MKKIGIIAKPLRTEPVRKVLEGLLPWLEDQGKEVFLDSETAALIEKKSSHKKSAIPSLVDMIIVLGGDGTLLSVARLVEGRNVPILGVNLGGLGFLTEVTAEEMYPALAKIFKNEFETDERLLLKVGIHRQGEQVVNYTAMNDVVISKGTLPRMIDLEVRVNSEFVTSLRGDGVIIATPTGSTAYSMSAGGPIIEPSVEAVLVTPISPHTLSHRPLVIPNNARVEVVLKTVEEGATVTFDGQVAFTLCSRDVAEVWPADNKTRLIRSPRRHYYEVLRQKLQWGKG